MALFYLIQEGIHDMKVIEVLLTAWKSIQTNLKRSLLTMVGITIGIASVVVIVSLGNGIKKETLKNLQADSSGRQTIEITYTDKNPNSYRRGFSTEDIELLKQSDESIDKISILDNKNSFSNKLIINGQLKSATFHLTKKATNENIIVGSNLSKAQVNSFQPMAMISDSVAKKYYDSPSNALNSSLSVDNTTYTVTGVFKNKKNDGLSTDVILPLTTYKSAQTKSTGDTIKVTFQRNVNIEKAAKNVVKNLNKNGSQKTNGKYEYIDIGSLLSGVSNVISGITYFISAIAGISLFIAGIGVMNMLYISVSERTKEIGVRRAIGAKKKEIMIQFLLEAVILTTLGGLLGFIMGAGLAMIISQFLPFPAVITASSFVTSFVISTVVGVIFGILPARQAADRNLIDILK